jgi:hypothetical protein
VGLSVAMQRPGKHIPAAAKNRWRRRFLCDPCCVEEIRRLVISRTSCLKIHFNNILPSTPFFKGEIKVYRVIILPVVYASDPKGRTKFKDV